MAIRQELNTRHHCVYGLQTHLVLATKYRHRCITAPMLDRFETIFTDLCAKWECELLEFGGEPDHVHLLVALQPKIAPSVFVNNLKTVSSRLIRKEFAEHVQPFYWKPVF
jgi:putative transposase